MLNIKKVKNSCSIFWPNIVTVPADMMFYYATKFDFHANFLLLNINSENPLLSFVEEVILCLSTSCHISFYGGRPRMNYEELGHMATEVQWVRFGKQFT